jgi:hypothetical protein
MRENYDVARQTHGVCLEAARAGELKSRIARSWAIFDDDLTVTMALGAKGAG